MALARSVFGVFEVFDIAARAAVTRAHEEARSHGSAYIGTEHLLLGVLGRGPDGAVGETLTALNMTVEAVRARVEDSIGPTGAPQPGYLRFSRRAKLALQRTHTLSTARGQESVGPLHVLAALMSDGQSGAAKTVTSMGVEPAAVRDHLLNSIAGQSGGQS